jgi:hypothetical protein
MEKDTTICFQTTSEISNALGQIAEHEKLSVSEAVHDIINRYLKDKSQGDKQNRRRFERKKIELPAWIGDPRWQRRDFKEITIMDISIGGIQFAVPKGTQLEIQKDGDNDTDKFVVIFRLPDYLFPIKVQISPQRVFESAEHVQVGAALVNPDFQAYTSLRQYMV